MRFKTLMNRRLPSVVREAVKAAKSSPALRAEWSAELSTYIDLPLSVQQMRIKVAGRTMNVFARHGYVLTADQALQVGTLVYPYHGD